MKYKSSPEFNHSFHGKARQLQPEILGTETWNLPLAMPSPAGAGCRDQLRGKVLTPGWEHGWWRIWLATGLSTKQLQQKQNNNKKKRCISTYKSRVKIPESLLTLLWHMPCLRSGEQVQLVKWDEPTHKFAKENSVTAPFCCVPGLIWPRIQWQWLFLLKCKEEMIYYPHIWEMFQ